jgi:hypothetical protein
MCMNTIFIQHSFNNRLAIQTSKQASSGVAYLHVDERLHGFAHVSVFYSLNFLE